MLHLLFRECESTLSVEINEAAISIAFILAESRTKGKAKFM